MNESLAQKLGRLDKVARAIDNAIAVTGRQFDLDGSEKDRIHGHLKAARDELAKITEEIWSREAAARE